MGGTPRYLQRPSNQQSSHDCLQLKIVERPTVQTRLSSALTIITQNLFLANPGYRLRATISV
jgi:hypothetical protein